MMGSVPGMLVCSSSFLISVCMFIVSKVEALLISSAAVVHCAVGSSHLG